MARPSLDVHLLAKVAHEYYVNGLSQREIGLLPDVNKKQTTIAQWIKRSTELGMVAIDIDPSFGSVGIESPSLAERMRSLFGLADCVVVDPGPTVPEDSRAEGELHNTVALATGVRLKEWLQPGSHVAIAGGRAVVQVTRLLKRRALPRRDIVVSPLSGRIWTGLWQVMGTRNLQRPLDADDAAALLAFAFERERGTRFSQIGSPLFPAVASRQLAEIQRAQCAFLPGGKWNWGLRPPDRALVGIGVLHRESGHRISEYLGMTKRARDSDAGARHLQRISKDLRSALALAETTRMGIGDLGNRLFPTIPLPNEVAAASLDTPAVMARLLSRVESINRRALVFSWEHLRQVGMVWAIGAGELKRHALWTILLCDTQGAEKGRRRLVESVSVDAASAMVLIEAKRAVDSSRALSSTFERLTKRLFT